MTTSPVAPEPLPEPPLSVRLPPLALPLVAEPACTVSAPPCVSLPVLLVPWIVNPLAVVAFPLPSALPT